MKSYHARLIAFVVFALVIMNVTAMTVGAAPAADRRAGEIKIEGIATTLTATTITVANEVIDISRAEIYPGVRAGASVEIYATPNAAGVWVAREVDTDDRRPLNQAEVTGVVEAIDGSLITIGGRTYDVTDARLRGTIAVGEVVELTLFGSFNTAAGGTTWTVFRAELDDDSGDDDDSDDRGRDDDDDDSDDRGRDDDDDDSDGRGSDDDGSDDSDDDNGGSRDDDDDDDDDSGSDDDDDDDDDNSGSDDDDSDDEGDDD